MMRLYHRSMLTKALLISLLACGSCRHLVRLEQGSREIQAGVRYWHEETTSPRPLHIHVLQADLRHTALVMESRIAADPDGVGPAEAQLQKPEELAAQPAVIAAINANAFGSLPDAKGQRDTHWHEGMPVDIVGWARHAGLDRSGPQTGNANFWIDGDHRAHVGAVAASNAAAEAVAGFSLLLRNGAVVAGTDAVLHPRTAVGVDKDGRHVWWVVVDGRRTAYSEGMSCHELAEYMQRLGCQDALNLDGGGSSVMMLKRDGGSLSVVNRPSGDATRPVPVMILLKRMETP